MTPKQMEKRIQQLKATRAFMLNVLARIEADLLENRPVLAYQTILSARDVIAQQPD